MTDEMNQETPTTGMGIRLKQAREAMQLTQKEAAIRLHLTPNIIHILEQENFSNTLPPTFLKGYLRSYARLLNINDKEIDLELDKLGLPHQAPTAPMPRIDVTKTYDSDRYFHWISYFVLAVLLVLVGVWWNTHVPAQHTQEATIKNTPAPATPDQTTAVANTQATTPDATPATTPDTASAATPDANPATTATDPATATTAQTTATAPADNTEPASTPDNNSAAADNTSAPSDTTTTEAKSPAPIPNGVPPDEPAAPAPAANNDPNATPATTNPSGIAVPTITGTPPSIQLPNPGVTNVLATAEPTDQAEPEKPVHHRHKRRSAMAGAIEEPGLP